MAEYANVDALVDVLLQAGTLRAIDAAVADADSWLESHKGRRDRAMIATAMEAVAMTRSALVLQRAEKRPAAKA